MSEKLAEIRAEELLQNLIDSPFAFAGWRLPGGEPKYAISLDPVSETSEDISSLSPGFLINKFSSNHPVSPVHIPAHLLIEKEEIKSSPIISSERIDSFLNDLNEANKTTPEIGSDDRLSADYEVLVQKAISQIRLGRFDKVVLSRFKDIGLSDWKSPIDFFKKLCANYPNAFCSIVHLPGNGIWIGASPELLVSANRSQFTTVSLAGTKRLPENESLADLAWTQKEIEEQAFVSRYVINCFKKLRLREFDEQGPKTIQAGNLAHLKTEYRVSKSETGFDDLENQMLDLLHPTSAVCGMPLEETRNFVLENEGFDREYFSGFLGPVNVQEETNLYVNLRCMKVTGNTARFYAGAGITENSNPQKELQETNLKMDILRGLL